MKQKIVTEKGQSIYIQMKQIKSYKQQQQQQCNLNMSTKKKIKLLTYNVFLRPPPIKTNQDDYKEERFKEIKEVMKQYDIVCFQEMFQTGTFRNEHIIQFAIQNQFYYWKTSDPPSFLPGPVVDSGLLVLSKYPILNSFFQSYGFGVLSDSASDKGYIYCKIKIQNDFLHLFTTHLQASYMDPGKQLQRELSVVTRLAQCKILADKIVYHLKENHYSEKDLIILAGDLNINAKENAFKLTMNSYLSENQPKSFIKQNQNHTESMRKPLNEQQQFFQQFKAFNSIFAHNNISIIDHLFIKYKQHPTTFGDNEKILTGIEQSTSYQSLDYMFTLLLDEDSPKSTLRGITSSAQVQKYLRPNEKYGLLSDHYGISMVIN